MTAQLRCWMRQNHARPLAVTGLLVVLWAVYRIATGPVAGPHHSLRPLFTSEPPAANIVPSGPASSYPGEIHPDHIEDPEASKELCARYGLLPLQGTSDGATRRAIYDIVLVDSELEMLEVRLGTLAPHVDYFVVVETDRTLKDPSSPKPRHVRDHWERYAPWHGQLIYRALDLADPAFADSSPRAREQMAWDAAHQAVSLLAGRTAPGSGDVLLVGNVDEIWRPSALRVLRNCEIPDRVVAKSVAYSYGFQWREAGPDAEWMHPQATTFRGPDTITPTDLRYGKADYILSDGGWHCSWCFGTLHEMVAKLTSYHTSEGPAKPEKRQPGEIVSVVREGHDM